MIKVSFPLYQGNDSALDLIWSAMDVKKESTNLKDNTIGWFSDLPNFTLIRRPAIWDKNKMIIEAAMTYEFPSIEAVYKTYEKVITILPSQVYAVSKGMVNTCMERVFNICSKDYWFNPSTNSYFYFELDSLQLDDEFKDWIEKARAYDTTWMMADRPNSKYWGPYQNDLIAEAKRIGAKRCELYYNWILGNGSLFALGAHTSKGSYEETYEEFNMQPQTPPVDDRKSNIYGIRLITPCIGFLPHSNKTGWHPNDLKYEYASNNPFITQEEYLTSEQ